jgi:RHS repeat-associated protein
VAGNPIEIQYSDGVTKSYTYDADNRLTTANGIALAYDTAGRVVSSNGLGITRDPVGRIASVTYGPGKTVMYTYNPNGLLAQILDWAGGSATFDYDNAARLVSISRSNGVTTQYNYDDDSQISRIVERFSSLTLTSVSLQRDAAGKVTSATPIMPQSPNPAPGVIGFSYGAADQVSTYSYDGLGRLTQDLLTSYTWNLASELTSYSGANGPASLTYDGFGMRISSTSGGSTQSYLWNYALGLAAIGIVRSGGADQRYYVYAPSGALLDAIDPSTNVHHWYHFDEIGSTTILTDDLGSVTDSYGITPYGETVSHTGTTPNPFTWLGEWGVMQEGESGLYYMRARYYDGTTARFLSPDPVQQVAPLAADPYEYAFANPMSSVDPMGDDPVGAPGFWESLIPIWGSGRESINHFQQGNYGRGVFWGVLAVTDVFLVRSIVTGAGKLVVRGGAALFARGTAQAVTKAGARTTLGPSLEAARAAALAPCAPWRRLGGLPRVQIMEHGEWFVKRVDPNSGRLMKIWGESSLEAQYRGLESLGDMAAEHAQLDGLLFTRNVGPVMPTTGLATRQFWSTWVKGSYRMGTILNDIRPRNLGLSGVVFDPAFDEFTKLFFHAGAGNAVRLPFTWLEPREPPCGCH